MPDMRILGAGADRLWNTASIILPEFPSVRWVRALERQGFLISSGSACATGKSGASHVLAAMGVTPAAAERVIRISSGFETKAVDWADLAGAIMEAYEVLKNDAATSTGRVISID
jgi:cysteine desulfurase